MKRLAVALLLLAALVAAQTAKKSGDTKKPAATAAKHMFSQDDVQWGPAPPFIPPGAQVAVLEGNPMGTSGDFTIRVKAPDGYVVPPHSHPKRENVTVVAGAMKVGMGDKFDESKTKTVPTGGFFYMDPSMHHFVKTQGETIVQIHGAAPLAFNYVNPNDDPSKKK